MKSFEHLLHKAIDNFLIYAPIASVFFSSPESSSNDFYGLGLYSACVLFGIWDKYETELEIRAEHSNRRPIIQKLELNMKNIRTTSP